MKTLLLLRHAKSCWEDSSLADHDRPLKSRGIKAAGRIGQLIGAQKCCPELVLCSTAIRAKETLRLVLEESKAAPEVEYVERLYHCSLDVFISVLKSIPWDLRVVMLVGHNPGLEEFLSHLIGQPQTMQTGALARIELDLPQWSDFNSTMSGRLADLWRPRALKGSE
ncbi:MAG TPA: histidine phosphatase family protein [Schlesneria sp.]